MFRSFLCAGSLAASGRYCALIILLLTGIWCIGAVFYTILRRTLFRAAAALIFTAVFLFLWIWAWKDDPWLLFGLLIIEAVVISHFLLMTPQEVFRNTQWQKPWLYRPQAIIENSHAKILFVRNFIYRSENDYDANYITMDIDLDKVYALDVALSHWDGMANIAHTMLSFAFADGQHLVFSMETRLPEGVTQGMIPGLYKQYELLPIAGTEEDIFKLRTNYRGEELYLYRTNATTEQCRMILKEMLDSINRLQVHPRFYNSLTHNCTTSLTPILRKIKPGFSSDIRLLFNGRSDEMLFEMGFLASRPGESFADLKKRRKVNQYVDFHPEYSTAIRTNLQ